MVKNPDCDESVMGNIISLPITSAGTTLVFPFSTRVASLVGYFDKPTNSATLPLISIYDAKQTDTLPATAKFVFIPTHEKDKESGATFDINLQGTLFTKGIVVVVGSFTGSTGALYITHD